MTLPFHDGTNTQFVFDEIAKSLIDTGGRQLKLRFGSSSVTFTASANSAQITVPHGLGSIPALVGAFAKTPANARTTVQESAAADATSIFLTGFQTQGTAITATQNIYWIAIG